MINLKKNKWIWIILSIIIIIGLIGGYLYFSNNSSTNENKEKNYEANKTSTNSENNSTSENISNETENPKNVTEIEVPATEQSKNTTEVISTFSTKIYNKESARQNNINITCATLDNTTVKNGETFSFCNTVRTSHNSKRISKSGYL